LNLTLKRSGYLLFALFLASSLPNFVSALFNLSSVPSVRIMGVQKVNFYPDDGAHKRVTRQRILGTIFQDKNNEKASTDIQVRLFDEFNDQNQTESNLSLDVRSIEINYRDDLMGGYKIWEGPVQVRATQFISNKNRAKTSRTIQLNGTLQVSNSPRHTSTFNSLIVEIPADPKTGRERTSYVIVLDARFPQS